MRRRHRLARIALSVLGSALIATFVPNPLHPQGDVRTARVDQLFARWDRPGSPGCALSIVQNGHAIYQQGYGYANLDHDVPITPSTVFYMASVSKQFAAANVALAARQGHLSLDDDIRKYLPEMRDYGRPITVRNLVHHTSGIRDYLALLGFSGRIADLHTNQEIIDLIARQSALNFPTGSEWSYSNSGYFLLSMIVERATGKSLRVFAQDNMFGPLGMASTHFHDDVVRTHVIKRRAIGYMPSENGFTIGYVNTFDKVGDGGLYSTAEDMVRWDRNFYEPVVGGRDFLEEIQVPGRLANGQPLQTANGDTIPYAFALFRESYRGLPTVGHSGGFMGYRTEFIRFPTQGLTVICLCNGGNINPGAIAKQIADIYLADHFTQPAPEPPPPFTPPAEITIPERELRAFEGSYYSDDLLTTYVMSVQDGRLMLRFNAAVPAPLAATEKDTFRMTSGLGAGTIKFERDGRNRVTGFTVSAGRAANIAFVKQ